MQLFTLRAAAALLALFFACKLHAQTTIEALIEQTGVVAGEVALQDRPGWRKPQKIIVRDIFDFHAQVAGIAPGVELIPVASQNEALQYAADADAIIGFCSEALVAAAPRLVWIQLFSAGAERCLAVERVAAGEIVLTNMQKMSSPVIAEHVTAMVLASARGLGPFSKAMRDGEWRRGPDMTAGMQSVAGKTVLVLGLGGIGTESARRLAALGMRVVATRRSSREGPEFVAYVGLASERNALAAQADFIVNALPLTAETSGALDAEFFASVKRGAHFINVGRGKTVDTSALVAALESGQLAGAALDVTDPEPLPPEHPLWQMPNVIITPHVAGRGGNFFRHGLLAKENLRRFVAGGVLLNVVDPNRGY